MKIIEKMKNYSNFKENNLWFEATIDIIKILGIILAIGVFVIECVKK